MSQNSTTIPTIATDLISRAMRAIAANEGRTLDFETADDINRTLLAATNALSEAPVVSLSDDNDMSDEEWLEIEMRLSRDHDDSQFWTGGAL
jgi:hypothetical protein